MTWAPPVLRSIKHLFMKEKKYTRKGFLLRIALLLSWFLLLVALVDGLGLFSVMESYLGYIATEIILWIAVFAVAVPVTIYAWRYLKEKR